MLRLLVAQSDCSASLSIVASDPAQWWILTEFLQVIRLGRIFYSTDIARLKGETVAEEVRKINPEFEFEFHALDYCTVSHE